MLILGNNIDKVREHVGSGRKQAVMHLLPVFQQLIKQRLPHLFLAVKIRNREANEALQENPRTQMVVHANPQQQWLDQEWPLVLPIQLFHVRTRIDNALVLGH